MEIGKCKKKKYMLGDMDSRGWCSLEKIGLSKMYNIDNGECGAIRIPRGREEISAWGWGM